MKAFPPWLRWYFADFAGGVAHLSRDDVGSYILLLAWSWENGQLPTDDRLRKIARCSAREWDNCWLSIRDKFRRTKDGWVNDRLERSRAEAVEFAAKRSRSARTAANSRWQDASGMRDASVTHHSSNALGMRDACVTDAGRNADAMRDECVSHAGRNADAMRGECVENANSATQQLTTGSSYLPSVDTPPLAGATAREESPKAAETTADEGAQDTDDGADDDHDDDAATAADEAETAARAAAVALAKAANDLCDWLFDRCVEAGVISEHWTTLRRQWLRDSFDPAKVLVAHHSRAEIEAVAERMIGLVKARKIRRKPDCAALLECWDWDILRADPVPSSGISATAAAAADAYLRSVGAPRE